MTEEYLELRSKYKRLKIKYGIRTEEYEELYEMDVERMVNGGLIGFAVGGVLGSGAFYLIESDNCYSMSALRNNMLGAGAVGGVIVSGFGTFLGAMSGNPSYDEVYRRRDEISRIDSKIDDLRRELNDLEWRMRRIGIPVPE